MGKAKIIGSYNQKVKPSKRELQIRERFLFHEDSRLEEKIWKRMKKEKMKAVCSDG